jgi:succinoglycan biosynthesis transport protein ExoP
VDEQTPDGRAQLSTFPADQQGGVRYLQALREHWVLIVAVIVAAVATAAVYSLTAPKRYKASTDVLVTPIAANDETFIGIGVLRETTQSRSVVTAARLIKTAAVANAVKKDLGLQTSTGALLGKINIKPQEQSNIVTIEATAGSASQAADLANGFAEALIAERSAQFQRELSAVINRLESRLAAIPSSQANSGEAVAIEQRLGELASLVGAKDPTVQISAEAVPPGAPSWPRPKLSIAVALLAALLLGVGIALALEYFNPLIRREEDLVEQRLPVLARIPRLPQHTMRDYSLGREPLPPDFKESFRVLRATVATAGADGGLPRSILVASASPAEGKSVTAVNLAVVLATAGARVILVDADLHRPMVSTLMHVPPRPDGLVEFAENGLSPAKVLTDAPGYGDNLRLLLARPHTSSRLEVMRPDRIGRALQVLENNADVVIVDSPPLSAVADALTFSEVVEAIVMSVFLGRTRRDKLNDAMRMLSHVGANVLGFVVVDRGRSRGTAYYYGSVEEDKEARQTALARTYASS